MNEVKIRKVDVTNLKAVSSFTAFFDGKSAHVTGANGHGKSTVIRALTDRLRGLKPEVITKIGEDEGKTTIELTDGCKFVWEYNDKGQDKLSYFAPNEFKPARREIFKSMCSQYFPNQFDINKFLTTTEPRKRLQMISELINVDLSEVQGRYKGVSEVRKDAKKALKLLEDQIMPKPDSKTFEGLENSSDESKNVDEISKEIEGAKISIQTEKDRLNAEYLINKKVNDEKQTEHKDVFKLNLNKWVIIEDNREGLVDDFNSEQSEMRLNYNDIYDTIAKLMSYGFKSKELDLFLKTFTPKNQVTYTRSPTPELKALNLPDPMPSAKKLNELELKLSELETKLTQANEALKAKESELNEVRASKQVYDIQIEQYTKHQKTIKERYDNVQKCEADVLEVFNEIKAIISASKLPDDFNIDLTDKNDILFRVTPNSEYLPITNETLATSAIFIAAFKLQASYSSAFKAVHFDVSYLDFLNREKVLHEAISMGIQLITESPGLSKGEMELQYVITEE